MTSHTTRTPAGQYVGLADSVSLRAHAEAYSVLSLPRRAAMDADARRCKREAMGHARLLTQVVQLGAQAVQLGPQLSHQ